MSCADGDVDEPPQKQLPHEIKVSTTWADLLDREPPATSARRVGGHEVWLLESLFSEGECRRLVLAAERHGFGRTNYPQSYRGNLRLTTTDFSLADAVWARLQRFVPATMQLEAGVRMAEEGIEESDEEFRCGPPETWDAHGLNEVWRLAKYRPGDQFHRHCDYHYPRQFGVEESMLTVNVYMNEGFIGGSTRFYFDDQDDGRGESDFEVVPKTGLCLLFRQPPGQRYCHDGAEVLSGFKYLFRSDVMYRMRG
eukprot:CAMPEP_0176194278 /NCGR_PEP_ID=MMETSP0121_2-20121125/5918_1 /TAXON_ID=160619 /ORGANISM="Kryptoperidinium foliaceum, Strain CCMP 1326" /LENGTH=252 /DNA_ID=CAMNT_0017533019 /DNA_START=1 /DNA_END=755 /DNA_ORIENTATION=-